VPIIGALIVEKLPVGISSFLVSTVVVTGATVLVVVGVVTTDATPLVFA